MFKFMGTWCISFEMKDLRRLNNVIITEKKCHYLNEQYSNAKRDIIIKKFRIQQY